MKQTLLDVVVDEAFLLDLKKVLTDYRNTPPLDPALNTFQAAMRMEKELSIETVRAVVMLMERRRAPALDSEMIDAVDRLQVAHTAMEKRVAARQTTTDV